eukprot:TRINITY_DN2480_c0_g1_i8.p1 TRINITY_DN2480_c0_g1~~TRINITY_DN2480_c0_g1_i8.p1  ORF type:complete len:567 (+),score=78.49 TRINITY_DN2480_c0_g1_i8:52-1752(+)
MSSGAGSSVPGNPPLSKRSNDLIPTGVENVRIKNAEDQDDDQDEVDYYDSDEEDPDADKEPIDSFREQKNDSIITLPLDSSILSARESASQQQNISHDQQNDSLEITPDRSLSDYNRSLSEPTFMTETHHLSAHPSSSLLGDVQQANTQPIRSKSPLYQTSPLQFSPHRASNGSNSSLKLLRAAPDANKEQQPVEQRKKKVEKCYNLPMLSYVPKIAPLSQKSHIARYLTTKKNKGNEADLSPTSIEAALNKEAGPLLGTWGTPRNYKPPPRAKSFHAPQPRQEVMMSFASTRSIHRPTSPTAILGRPDSAPNIVCQDGTKAEIMYFRRQIFLEERASRAGVLLYIFPCLCKSHIPSYRNSSLLFCCFSFLFGGVIKSLIGTYYLHTFFLLRLPFSCMAMSTSAEPSANQKWQEYVIDSRMFGNPELRINLDSITSSSRPTTASSKKSDIPSFRKMTEYRAVTPAPSLQMSESKHRSSSRSSLHESYQNSATQLLNQSAEQGRSESPKIMFKRYVDKEKSIRIKSAERRVRMTNGFAAKVWQNRDGPIFTYTFFSSFSILCSHHRR